MRKSTVLFVLVSIVCALATGCVPNADRGPAALVPRSFPAVETVRLTPPTTLPASEPFSNAQRSP